MKTLLSALLVLAYTGVFSLLVLHDYTPEVGQFIGFEEDSTQVAYIINLN